MTPPIRNEKLKIRKILGKLGFFVLYTRGRGVRYFKHYLDTLYNEFITTYGSMQYLFIFAEVLYII